MADPDGGGGGALLLHESLTFTPQSITPTSCGCG